MSKEKTKRSKRSKLIIEKLAHSRNTLVGMQTESLDKKGITFSQLGSRGAVQKQRLSNSLVVINENSVKEQLNRELQFFIKNPEFDDFYVAQKEDLKFQDILSNKLLLVMVIRKGIPFSIFTLIQNITPFSFNDWASFLDISSKSLTRYRHQDITFKPSLSEKIFELAEVTNLGVEVFGNNEKFKSWLETPNYALGNLKPFDLLRDSYGKEMIIGELTRIEHGILV